MLPVLLVRLSWHKPVRRNANPATLSAEEGSHYYHFGMIRSGIELSTPTPEADALPLHQRGGLANNVCISRDFVLAADLEL